VFPLSFLFKAVPFCAVCPARQVPTVLNCHPAMYAVSAVSAGTGGEAAWLASQFDNN
jgi:hypothetical protein